VTNLARVRLRPESTDDSHRVATIGAGHDHVSTSAWMV
jgi:hypothetical protein